MELLQETTDEMARNGCKKIIIVNGHGGNENLLPFFAQSQLEKRHDYVVYVMGLVEAPSGPVKRRTSMDMHAGESETSKMMISRPDLVHLDRAGTESGADQARLKLPRTLYTAIWWYARFPNHYSGDGSAATQELGAQENKRMDFRYRGCDSGSEQRIKRACNYKMSFLTRPHIRWKRGRRIGRTSVALPSLPVLAHAHFPNLSAVSRSPHLNMRRDVSNSARASCSRPIWTEYRSANIMNACPIWIQLKRVIDLFQSFRNILLFLAVSVPTHNERW